MYTATAFYHIIIGKDAHVYRERIRKISPSPKDLEKH